MKKNRSFLATFFIIATVIAILVRYSQFVAEIIDFNTGFFYHYAGVLKHLHYIVLGVVFVGFIILSVIEKKRKTPFFSKRLSFLDDVDTRLCGMMFLLAGFSVIYTAVIEGFPNYGFAGFMTVMLGTGAYVFAGGVLFIKKRTYPSVGMALLALSGYYVARLIILFIENYVIINMSEHLTRLLITLFMSLFYLSAGRMFMRAESGSTRKKACVFGFFGAVAAVCEIAAKLVFLFGSSSVVRDNLMRSPDTKFIMPDMLAAAETIALITFLLIMTKYKYELIRTRKEKKKKASEE